MSFFISLLAVLSISALLIVRFKVNSAIAPFATVSLITLFLCYLSTLNLLMPAVYVVFAAAIFSLIYIFWFKRKDLMQTAKDFFKPGMVFFIVSVCVFYYILYFKFPFFTHWDEFSFWGVAAKNVFENRQIYTLFKSSMINISYPPGLPVWSFFMQCTGSSFKEWLVYLAYDTMIMSVFSMFFSRIKWKNYIAIPVIAFTSVASLYVFCYSFEGLTLYSTAYSDVQVGIMFGATLIAWFSSDDRGFPRYLVSMLSLMLLPMIKDIGLAFGLVAATIMAFDMIISANYPSERVFKCTKKAVRLVYPALLFVAIITSYFIWTKHFAAATSIDRVTIPYEYGIFQMLTGKDPYFNIMFGKMWDALFVRQLVSFGNIFTMLIVFTLIPIIISFFVKERKNRFRLCSSSVLLLAGFFLYYLFQTYAYTAIFAHSDEYPLTSFERYVSSYPIGWMLIVFGLCFFAISKWRFKKSDTIIGITVSALLLGGMWYYTPVPFNEYVLTSDKVYVGIIPLREMMHDSAVKFQGAFTTKDRIYYQCQNSDGGEWFYFNYEFQPAYTVKTLAGGNFVAKGSEHDGRYDVEAGIEEFSDYLIDRKAGYVYIQKIDDYFFEEFAPMFSDGLMGFYDGTCNMYRIVREKDKVVTLIPVYNAEHVQQLREQYGY